MYYEAKEVWNVEVKSHRGFKNQELKGGVLGLQENYRIEELLSLIKGELSIYDWHSKI